MSRQHIDIIESIETAVATNDLARLDQMAADYFERAEAGPRPFSAAIKLSPRGEAAVGQDSREAVTLFEESALGLNFANIIERGRRLIKYRLKLLRNPTALRIVAEGDSWFQYPFLLQDIIDVLMEREQYAVNCISAAGDTIENMRRSGEYINAIAEQQPAIFLFSGGGNDLVGDGKLRAMLRPYTPGAEAEALIDDGAFNAALDAVMDGFETIVSDVGRRFPHVKMLSHGYGHPVKVEKGPWVWPYMQEKGIPVARAREIVALMIDRFNARLAMLSQRQPHFTHVNVTKVVGNKEDDWYDALHPENPGYGRAAALFIEKIDKLAKPARPVEEGARVFATTETLIQPALTQSQTEGDPLAWRDFGPEAQWRQFRDPDIHKQIRDVISLLQQAEAPESPGIMENRLKLAAASEAPAADFPEALSPSEVEEAIIGGDDLEPVQTLLLGYHASKTTGLISHKLSFGGLQPRGTGCLVGPGLLLTNHHVLPSAEYAAHCELSMDDERALLGQHVEVRRFKITPDIYYASRDFDFAFVSVEPRNADGKLLSDYGSLELIGAPGKAIKREPVSIIQHAGGQAKTIALRNSFIMGRVDEGIYYTSDTLPGSSGSVLLNKDWQVVALHHRSVPHPTIDKESIANRGIRISAIIEQAEKDRAAGSAQAARVCALIGSPPPNAFADVAAAQETRSSVAPSRAESLSQTESPSQSQGAEIDGAYAGLTEAQLIASIGRSDQPDDGAGSEAAAQSLNGAVAAGVFEALPGDRDRVARAIGEGGMNFIIGHEVSSPQEYRRRFKNPILPGAESGITIGIGYDLGYHSAAEFSRHWEGLLSSGDKARLTACLGKKRPAAIALLATVRDIEVPFEDALEVFKRASLPRVFGQLNRHIGDAILSRLPPDCVAALISLTFNRGPNYAARDDRYREMREIKASLNSGRYGAIPELIRAMKRLWIDRPDVRGLLRRRDEEAALFERGLLAMRSRAEEALDAGASLPTESGRDGGETDDVDQFEDFQTLLYSAPDGQEDSELGRGAGAFESFAAAEAAQTRLGIEEVQWVRAYSNNPDYWHLPAEAEGQVFALTPELIERAIAAARCQPHFSAQGLLVVAVRGAAIETGENRLIEKNSVRLREQKPDHQNFRCVIAVYDRPRGLVSAFKASTVPNRGGVASQFNRNAGLGGTAANMLPTGCYELCVGVHNGRVTVPSVLRLGTGPTAGEALLVTTLRTINDGVYGVADFWDRCRPMDNLHPAFSARFASFSSLGCLTIPGRFANGRHSGDWAKFRETARFDSDSALATRYNLLLTTGMELAALAAAPDAKDLRRLSHGSRGAEVSALQRLLGIRDNGVFEADTKKALVAFEQSKSGGKASGIYSIRSERELGLAVFG